ncbi:transglycosylase SLT domain-containing protein [Nocardia sp. NPDC050793]|uniref:lytic transglycosylase domain-containing protein n=1 Tax=Nocardia sp. NPDC050793 TaxID=3155159 RepID=UPI0033C12081
MANYSAGTASVEITPDFSNFVRDLRTDLERVEAEYGVEINADTSGLAEDLRTKLALIDAELGVGVGVDQTSLDNLEAVIRAKLAEMDLRVDVKVGADTRTAADDLAALKAAYRQMTMDVDADTTAAAAQIGALNNIPVTANVRANVDRGGILSGLMSEPLMLNVGALGLAQLPAVASAVATIGADIQSLVQGATLLPGIFAAAGAGITTLAVGLDGMKDAFGDGKKAQQAYEGMSASGRQLVDTVKAVGPEWDRIGKRIQTITLDGLSKPTDHLLKTQLPALDRGMGAVADSMNRGFGTLLTDLASDKSVGTVDRVFGNTARSADKLNGAIKPIISSIETLAGTGSDKLPRLSQGLADAATRFDAFLTHADQSGDLSRWMNEAIDAGKNLVSVVGNVGSMVASVFRAAKIDGEGFLETADRLTEGWANWLKSSDGQATLITFLRSGREQLDQWKPVLSDVGSILKSVYEASQAWSAILLPFLQAASSLVGEHDGLVKTLLVSYLAYRTIGPILTLLQTGWSSATAAVGRYTAAQAAATGAGAGAFRSGIAGIAGMLGAGGIFGLALGGAALGLGLLATKHQEAAAAADDQRRKLEALRETLDEQTGSVTKETISATTKDLESRGFLERAETLGVNPQDYVQAGLGLDPAGKAAINDRITQIILEQVPQKRESSFEFEQVRLQTKLSDTEIAQALQGVPEAVEKYAAAQKTLQDQGITIVDLTELKDKLNDVAESAATLGGEMNGYATNTGQAAEAQRRINEVVTGTFQLTEQGRKSFEELGAAVLQVPNEKTVWVKAPPGQDPADFKARLEEMGRTVELLPDGTLKIILDDVQAKASIAEIVKPAVKPVTVTYTGEFNKPEGMRQEIPGRASGGPITGGTAGMDSVPILAMPGEHMLTTSDVDKLGGQAGVYRFRAALQAGLVRPMRDGGAVKPWDQGDQIDLQQAQNAIAEAEEDLRALDFKKNVTPAERRKAELEVEEARYKAQQLEDRKAGRTGSGPSAEILPQAELPGRRSNVDLDKEDADAAVDQANTKRNRIYDDPTSTDEQKRAADRDYQRAQNARAEAYKSKGTGADGDVPEISLPGIAASAAGILAEGFLSALGLENSILSGNNVYTKSLNKVIDFYGNKAKEDGQTDAAGGYDYTPKNLPQERESESSSSGAEGTKSGDSYDANGGVEQWRGTFAQVLRALAMPAGWLDLGLAQMKTESNGNPKAINLWDSNAQKGTPSKGIMQVIDPTFAAHRSALYPDDIWDPSANIAASLRYTVNRYGSPVGVWGQGHGYKDGGWVRGIGGPRDDLNQAWVSPGEFVVHAAAAAANAPALEAMNAGLPVPLPPLPAGLGTAASRPSSVTRDHSVNFHAPLQLNDPHELIREVDRWQAIQAQGAMAGLPG